PANAMVPVHLGTVLLMQGRREEARASYLRALELNPGVVPAHTALGIMAVEEGRVQESVGHWQSAVKIDERQYARILTIGGGFWRTGRRSQARPLLELFVDSAPPATWSKEIERVRALLAAEGTQ
ncbi:MAG: tetratricopeptide repeat protein, partial [Acidobacteriota bacterium]|nr:tetratricopeptide repeat protein [Acidobacteriota bacterium]